MEKERSSKVIAIIALFVGVVGLSLGFAAYSTSLKIESAANVTTGNTNWDVGFSVGGSNIEDVTTPTTKAANETGSTGVINVTKYTISQNTNPTLSTTLGSQASYTVNILNKGSLPAYLSSVTMGTLSCTSAPAGSSSLIEGQTGAGTTRDGGNSLAISDSDCAAMFRATLTIGSTTYTATNTPAPSGTLAATNGSTTATLTIEYIGNSAANAVAATLDGDIVVSLSPTTVIYTSTNPSP